MKQAALEEERGRDPDLDDPLLQWTGFPWWSALGLAGLAYALLQWIATRRTPTGVSDQALEAFSLLQRYATLGRHGIPIFLGVLALWAGWAKWRRGRLRNLARLVRRQTGRCAVTPKQRSTLRQVVAEGIADAKIHTGPTEPALQAPRPGKWDLALLQSIEWKRFEALCVKYFEVCGFEASLQAPRPDGGSDMVLRGRATPTDNYGVVHCRHCEAGQLVGAQPIRELLRIMSDLRVKRGIVVTSAAFTRDAREFAEGNPIFLIDGAALLQSLLSRPEEEQRKLLRVATQGAYRVPSCPRCGHKTQLRRSFRGAEYWTCVNEKTRCRYKLGIPPAPAMPAL